MALDAYLRYGENDARLYDLSAAGSSITTVNPQTSDVGYTAVALTAVFAALAAYAALRKRRRA